MEQKKKTDLLCIGSAIVDTIIRGFDPVPVSATGYVAASSTVSAGGEAVNDAVIASRLGLKTAILCRFGQDETREILEKLLDENGVDRSPAVETEVPTPVTVIFLDEKGNRKSITNEAHKYNFHPERHLECIPGCRAIALGSLFRAPFNDPVIIRKTLECAAASDVTVFADTKLPNFVRLSLEDIRDSLPLIDYIFPNEEEARFYSGKTEPEEMADVFLSYGVKNVIIKLGEKGCLFKNREQTLRLPSLQVEAVDATGAGDNFLAGFIYRKLNGASDADALRFAGACGALCATMVGTTAAVHDAGQVEELLARTGYEG